MAAMARRERIYEAIAAGIWGTASELTPAQVDEAYRVADLVLAADPHSDDGAASAGGSLSPAVSPTAPSSPFPRRFFLFRHADVSGVSGIGVVAEGAEFVDGAAALRWRGENPSTAAWNSVESLIAVHGHQGSTEIRWIDPEPHVGYWPVEEPPE